MKDFIGHIYKIENLINGKVYIGQTRQKDYRRRWDRHKQDLKNNKHHNMHLQRSYLKYGEGNFRYELLDNSKSQEELNDLEILYIKEAKSCDLNYGYNLDTGGKNNFVSEETKRKISISNKGRGLGRKLSEETKKRISISNTGRSVSDETKRKIGDANKISLIGKKQSEETILKKIKANSKQVFCIETGIIYKSVKSAYTILKIHRSAISDCLRGRRKTAGGYHWQYYKGENK